MTKSMRSAFAVLAVFGASILTAQTATLRQDGKPPEDPKVRAEAVALLERANRVSTPSFWPPNQMTLHFRVPNPTPGEPVEGDYVSSFGGPGPLRRQEWHYGAFQPIQIRNGPRLGVTQNTVRQPPILNLVPELTPVYLVRFDHEDIIRSITPGPDGQRCIQFDTIFGDRQQAGEICVDAEHGWLMTFHVGDQVTRNSKFFAFQDAFFPGHVERWIGNQEVMAIDSSIVAKSDYPPDYFSVPQSAAFLCQDFRRAYSVNTPQPPLQSSSTDVHDVSLTGMIGVDGHVSNVQPIDRVRPDLNDRAIALVSTWTFAPASCNGQPAAWQTVFVVHFKGL